MKIGQLGGCCCSFLTEMSLAKYFENEKFFLCLKIGEMDMGVNFGTRRTILDIKTHFLNVKPVFWEIAKYDLVPREIL